MIVYYLDSVFIFEVVVDVPNLVQQGKRETREA